MINRAVAPPFSEDFSFRLPVVEKLPLPNGVDFIFLPVQQDVVKLEVVFRAGKWFEPKNGVSHFTSILLDKGTKTKPAKEIAEYFDYYGASVEIVPGYDFVSVSLYTLSKNLSSVFPLFGEILSVPSFPENELALSQEIVTQELKINNRKNSFVASRLIRKNIFGDHHPYGISLSEIDVASLSVNDLQIFYHTFFSPFQVYLIGRVSTENLHYLTDYFSMPQAGTYSENPAEPHPLDLHFHQPVSDSLQTSIRMGKITLNRSAAEYPQLLLLNHVLGGYFGSRLMKNIREEKGLTYGIHSGVHSFKNSSLFSIGADVNATNLSVATREIQKEIDRLKEEPLSRAELTVCKNHFLGSLQLEAANPFSVMEKIKTIYLNQLNPSFYDTLFQAVQHASANDLQLCAEKQLHSFHLVSVG
ncbi:MAG: insulinase family protein [Bacteroidetes bacterium]|nr:insulinase family protein [Bacteroidota bacterium]